MIVLMEDIFLVNLPARKSLEQVTSGLYCFIIHTTMLESVMFAKCMLEMTLGWKCHCIFPYH